MAAADAIRRVRSRAVKLRTELAEATTAEAEAMAAARRVFGSASDVAEVTGIPVEEVERGAKGVKAGRAAVVAEEVARRVPRQQKSAGSGPA